LPEGQPSSEPQVDVAEAGVNVLVDESPPVAVAQVEGGLAHGVEVAVAVVDADEVVDRVGQAVEAGAADPPPLEAPTGEKAAADRAHGLQVEPHGLGVEEEHGLSGPRQLGRLERLAGERSANAVHGLVRLGDLVGGRDGVAVGQAERERPAVFIGLVELEPEGLGLAQRQGLDRRQGRRRLAVDGGDAADHQHSEPERFHAREHRPSVIASTLMSRGSIGPGDDIGLQCDCEERAAEGGARRSNRATEPIAWQRLRALPSRLSRNAMGR